MAKYQPLELPRGKAYGSNYYMTYSIKLQRNVILYSQLEYHNFLTLEMDPHVKDFCEQPLEIRTEIDNKIGQSVFDMWVYYDNDREEFQEVKYKKDLNMHIDGNNRVIEQIHKQKKWCQLNGYDYAIRTEEDIYFGPYYISNLRYLHGLIIRDMKCLSDTYIKQMIAHIKDSKVSVLILTQTLNISMHDIFSIIAYGLYTGVLAADIDKTILSYDTRIWVR